LPPLVASFAPEAGIAMDAPKVGRITRTLAEGRSRRAAVEALVLNPPIRVNVASRQAEVRPGYLHLIDG
jgi:hypothetical protein